MMPFNLPIPHFSREQAKEMIRKAVKEMLDNEDSRLKLIEMLVDLIMDGDKVNCEMLEYFKRLTLLMFEIWNRVGEQCEQELGEVRESS